MREHDQFDVWPLCLSFSCNYLYGTQPSMIRLGILLLLFDVYLTWARIEKQTSSNPSAYETNNSNFLRLSQQPIVCQYLFFRTRSFTNFPGPH